MNQLSYLSGQIVALLVVRKCGHKYMTARKPKLCEGCHFEIGGSYVPKPKLNIPDCVIVYIEGDTSLYSVNSSTRDDRCLVLVQGTNCLCYHETCKQQRAIHLSSSSERPFSCKHSEKIDRKPQEPLEKYFLSDESIRTYPADIGTQETILSLMERSSASQAVAMKVSDKTLWFMEKHQHQLLYAIHMFNSTR